VENKLFKIRQFELDRKIVFSLFENHVKVLLLLTTSPNFSIWFI